MRIHGDFQSMDVFFGLFPNEFCGILEVMHHWIVIVQPIPDISDQKLKVLVCLLRPFTGQFLPEPYSTVDTTICLQLF